MQSIPSHYKTPTNPQPHRLARPAKEAYPSLRQQNNQDDAALTQYNQPQAEAQGEKLWLGGNGARLS